MRYRCKVNVIADLKNSYEKIVIEEYNMSFLKALKNFDIISEIKLRENVMKKYYGNIKSLNQAWKSCKGFLYEYAVYESLKEILKREKLREIKLFLGEEIPTEYNEQVVIKNWCEIKPDIDILVAKRDKVIAIISCKTSLRERLTETAFWKREFEKNKENVKLFFITTDKDNELKIDTNRYILLHVLDCTFVTDSTQYEKLITYYKQKYGNLKDFDKLMNKVKPIDMIGNFLK